MGTPPTNRVPSVEHLISQARLQVSKMASSLIRGAKFAEKFFSKSGLRVCNQLYTAILTWRNIIEAWDKIWWQSVC